MIALALAAAVALGGAPKGPSKTQLKIEIKPAEAVLYVDGKRKGTGEKVHVLNVQPGNHQVRVVNPKTKDEHQDVLSVKRGETKSWQWAFEDEREDRKRAAEEAKDAEKKGEGGEAVPAGGEELKDPDLPR